METCTQTREKKTDEQIDRHRMETQHIQGMRSHQMMHADKLTRKPTKTSTSWTNGHETD